MFMSDEYIYIGGERQIYWEDLLKKTYKEEGGRG